MFGATWNKTTKKQMIYANGRRICTSISDGYLKTNSYLYIGSGAGTWDGGADMYGYISNLQIYNNTALTPSQVDELYLENLGGTALSGDGF
jgi:hypothetical protein